ncbi:MAG: hypothetical protein C4316_01455 [Chloroflexota bacterium]
MAGLADHLSTALVARVGDQLAGTDALEVYGNAALPRSVAVRADWRNRGSARPWSRQPPTWAPAGVREFYLLTETATGFFTQLGFRVVPSSEVPAPVQASAEFRGACPETAIAMFWSGGTDG